MDKNGYPKNTELKKIKEWPHTDFVGLMEYVEELWKCANDGFWRQDNDSVYADGSVYRIDTVGWSGNEDLIGALRENAMFWTMCWWSSERGGHYVFDIPKPKESK